MVEHLHTNVRSVCAMPSYDWRGVKLHHWTLEQWKLVLWSDESPFSLWQSDERVWVWWMSPGERFLPEGTVPTIKLVVLLGGFQGLGSMTLCHNSGTYSRLGQL